jgi:outer membrane lipoprotein-sorting protein
MPYLRPSFVLPGILTSLLALPPSAPAADDLNSVFSALDKAAVSFRGLAADVHKVKHTAVVPDDDEQTGKILVRRAKPHELQMRVDFDPPDQQEVVLDGTKAEIYYPKRNSITPYILGKAAKPMAEQLLLLGWGSTSQDLKSTFNVTYSGTEMVAGQSAARLVLIPKDKDLLTNLPKFELWIALEGPVAGVAIQVKFYEKGGKDYSVATYTNVKLRSVSESEVKLTAPKNAQREKPIRL